MHYGKVDDKWQYMMIWYLDGRYPATFLKVRLWPTAASVVTFPSRTWPCQLTGQSIFRTRPGAEVRRFAEQTSNARVHRAALEAPVERRVRRAELFATFSKVRKASLTASAVGKAAAISGLSKTRFVPLTYARWYFPRTPFPRSSRRYSRR